MTRPFIKHVHLDDLSWQPPGVMAGIAMKVLCRDLDSQAFTRVMGLVPLWRKTGRGACYHECAEEVFIVSGDLVEDQLITYRAGCYFYRPAAIVHGHTEHSLEHGCLMLAVGYGPMDFLEPGPFPNGEYPGEYPVREVGDPRGHVRFVDSNAMAWQQLDNDLAQKVLSRDPTSGAGSSLLKLPPGYESSAHSHPYLEEIFVLEGEFTTDEAVFRRGSYSCRPPGAVHGTGLRSGKGATLFVKQDGAWAVQTAAEPTA